VEQPRARGSKSTARLASNVARRIQTHPMPKLIDLTGRRFGRWTVLARHPERDHGATLWLCRCDDGVERVVDGNNLRRGLSKSCGCFKRERTKQCKTKTRHVWDARLRALESHAAALSESATQVLR